MTPEEFAQGFVRLSLKWQPKRYLTKQEHDLFDQLWWEQVKEWDGPRFVAAVHWWIGHRSQMPEFPDLRLVYDRLAPSKGASAALPPPIADETVMGPIRDQVARALRRGRQLEAIHSDLVLHYRRQGFALGSDALREAVRVDYERAAAQLAADEP
jgi:hypothetical protein